MVQAFDTAGAVPRTELANEFGQQRRHVGLQGERRIDHHQAVGGEASLGNDRVDMQLQTQQIADRARQVRGHALDDTAAFNRVPGEDDARAPLPVRREDRRREPLELVVGLERRIDQHQPPPLDRGDEGIEAGVAVERDDLGALVAADGPAQGGDGLRVRLAEDHPVEGSRQGEGDRRGTGIEAVARRRLHERVVRRDQRLRLRAHGRRIEPPDAGAPLLRAPGLRAFKIVTTAAGMRVDHPVGRRLALQIEQNLGQHRVLEHIREIAGVKVMAVIQGEPSARRGSTSSRRDSPRGRPRDRTGSS